MLAKLDREESMRALKYPDYATRGERCPWCKNLKCGRCSGCGQVYDDGSKTVRVNFNVRALDVRKVAKHFHESSVKLAAAVEQAVAQEVKRITSAVFITLPEPPAANRYLRRHGNVTYKTREAKAYCELVRALTAQYRTNGAPTFPVGDLAVVVVWRRSRKAGDLGERTKVLYDALQGTIYTDDKQIAMDWRRRCDEHPELAPGTVRVEVSAI